MSERCYPFARLPIHCAEAFQMISRQIGTMSSKLDAIHEQAVRINGQVAALVEKTGRHETQIQLLQADVAESQRGRATWARRLWQAVIGLALLLVGYLLKH